MNYYFWLRWAVLCVMRWGWVELGVAVQHPDIFLGKPFSIYRRLSLYITGIQKRMNLYKQAQITRYLSDVFEEAHMYLLGICSVKRLQILISFSLYIKNSRKMYQKKKLFGFFILDVHTVQTLQKYIWIRHWICISLIFYVSLILNLYTLL